MKKCKKCSKYIPYNTPFYEEYIAFHGELLRALKKKETDLYNFLYAYFQNIEKKIGKNLCLCTHNIQEKKEMLEKHIQKRQKNEEAAKSKKAYFIKNKMINFVKTKFDIKDLKDFIIEEKSLMSIDFDLQNNIFVDYQELLNIIKMSIDEKNYSKIEEAKKTDILVIYNFNIEDKEKEHYYYDKQIRDIIKYRFDKNKTTYLIYNIKANNDNFENTVIRKINEKELKQFYKTIYEPSNEISITKTRRKNYQRKFVIS